MGKALRSVIDKKLLKLIEIFLEKDDELFHLQKINKESTVPLGTCFRLIKILTSSELVDTINVGKLKLYKTNKKVAEEFKVLK